MRCLPNFSLIVSALVQRNSERRLTGGPGYIEAEVTSECLVAVVAQEVAVRMRRRLKASERTGQCKKLVGEFRV